MENSKQTTINEDDMIVAAYYSLKRMCDNMYKIVVNFRTNIAKPGDKEDIAIAQCILQMAICKTNSLLLLSNGINIVPNRTDISLFDPISMFSILRSLYELVFTFRNIYIMTDTKEQRQILLNIWKICGLNNRQKENALPNDSNQEFHEKQEKEANDIEFMRQEVISILATLNIKESAQKDVEKTLNEIIKKKNLLLKAINLIKKVLISLHFVKFHYRNLLSTYLRIPNWVLYILFFQCIRILAIYPYCNLVKCTMIISIRNDYTKYLQAHVYSMLISFKTFVSLFPNVKNITNKWME